jgi:hypothetical protein
MISPVITFAVFHTSVTLILAQVDRNQRRGLNEFNNLEASLIQQDRWG